MPDPTLPPESDPLAPSRGIAIAFLTAIPIWGFIYWVCCT